MEQQQAIVLVLLVLMLLVLSKNKCPCGEGVNANDKLDAGKACENNSDCKSNVCMGRNPICQETNPSNSCTIL